MLEEREGIVSKVAWKLRPTESLKLDSVKIFDAKYVAISNGQRQRIMALMRVRLTEAIDGDRLDHAATMRIAIQQQRMKGLFDGLYRAGVPFLYVTMMSPSSERPDEKELFEFDLGVGTWIDAKEKQMEEALRTLEQRANVLAATLSVALPSATVARLSRNELKDFISTIFLPSEPELRQVGTSSTVSTLGSFEERSPMVSTMKSTPQFYVPNANESGRAGILLGSVRSSGGDYHDFRLQFEDLRRHVAILGMTGSGKSTTARAMVRQIAKMGLPLIVLDWHNEYAGAVLDVGGTVVSPGKDAFALNPIEPPPNSESAEHIATVSDIFSDIYHFTHPQAYMFRNSLQRRISENSEEEVPSIASLVRTIEAYPLRSAYDNETKVALLRRLVPLTQGQAGRALGCPSTTNMEELLDKVVCVELGHLRDMQTRSIFSDIVLKLIYENRVRRKGDLDHVTVIEESRNIAPARRPEDPPSVGERMISELRKFGESMLFVAQFPTQVASEVIKNSGTRIIHRIAWPEDLALIGDSLSLTHDQREYITELGVGEAVLSLGRVQKPMLIQVKAEGESTPRRPLSFSGDE